MTKISILGTVGVPAAYGGFETLADNLVQYCERHRPDIALSVYCSGKKVEERVYCGAEQRFINLDANGVSSIPYDILSMFDAIRRRDNVILLLGVSGAIAIPIVRYFSKTKIVTNIDGLEWKRDKWSPLAKAFLRFSEKIAVKYSHAIIADNQGIAEHVESTYGKSCSTIAYGGDHAVLPNAVTPKFELPDAYGLALCRIEPENNISMILDAFRANGTKNIVFIGNWDSSEYGRDLRHEFGNDPNIHLLDPIYDIAVLKFIRESAEYYVHGHSAGGTNPSLVEMMHFEIPVYAFECNYNWFTTSGDAFYFQNSKDLGNLLETLSAEAMNESAKKLKSVAEANFTWDVVGERYCNLLTTLE